MDKLEIEALFNAPKQATERLEQAADDRESLENVIRFHVDFLDDICWGIVKNDVVLLGAATGAGKTALAKTIAQKNVMVGKKVTYFALEAERGEIELRILYEIIAQLVEDRDMRIPGLCYAGWSLRAYDDQLKSVTPDAMEIFQKNYSGLYTFYKRGDFDQAALVKEFYSAHSSSDLLILDHLHYVDSKDANENRAYKDLVKCVRDLALECDTPVICVAHLRKKDRGAKQIVPDIEDFHGSSDLIKVATKCVVLSPAYDQEAPNGVAPTYFHVGKDRRSGTARYVGLCAYNLRLNKYESSYKLGRMSYAGDGWEPTKMVDIPHWAKRAATETISVSFSG